MPVVVRKRGDKFRVVESGSGNVAKTAAGGPADGGGHATQAQANRQARAINSSLSRAGKI
jgi:hypothetical protein